MKVLGISGSLRRDSYNTKLLRAAEELLPAFAELEVWDELKAVPPFDRRLPSLPLLSPIGASTGAFGAVWAQAALRKVLTTAGARVVEAEVAVGHAPSKFGEAGELVDEEIVEQLSEAIDVLTAESAPVRPVALAF